MTKKKNPYLMTGERREQFRAMFRRQAVERVMERELAKTSWKHRKNLRSLDRDIILENADKLTDEEYRETILTYLDTFGKYREENIKEQEFTVEELERARIGVFEWINKLDERDMQFTGGSMTDEEYAEVRREGLLWAEEIRDEWQKERLEKIGKDYREAIRQAKEKKIDNQR